MQPSPAAPLATQPGANNVSISPVPQDVIRSIALPLPLTNGAETHARTSRAGSPEGGSTTFAGQYLGPTSPYTFLRRAWKRFEKDGLHSNLAGNSAEEPDQSEPIWAFGDRQVSPMEPDGFQLSNRHMTSMLLSQYFDLAMPTYRFLHKQTVARWLEGFHEVQEQVNGASLLPARQAIVLMVLATARLFNVGESKEILDPDEHSWRESEHLFRMAQEKLQAERGRARLESVQARLATCLFLLHTSRPNQAWYHFGTTIQLVMALGLHRATAGPAGQPQDCIIRECRKRAFWAASTLDTYLSVILGRPPLIHLDDVDQKLPDAVEDEDLTSTGVVVERPMRDSIIKASIFHAQITRIVKKAAREQNSVRRKSSTQKLETALKLNEETAAWHASLPVVLSGQIHASSLIPIFRRQITVLQLAHAHARMLINRPSLLIDTSQVALRELQVETCLSAAQSTLDAVLAAGLGKHIFQAFWYTQFVCFNALSIVYIWLIQRRHGRLPALTSIEDQELLKLADTVQRYLNEATQANAPSLRYSIVLEELQQEVQRMANRVVTRTTQINAPTATMSNGVSAITSLTEADAYAAANELYDDHSADPLLDSIEAFANDFPLDPDLWLSLDAFPFSDFGQNE